MRIIQRISILILALFLFQLFVQPVLASEEKVELHFYYSDNCRSCKENKENVIEKIYENEAYKDYLTVIYKAYQPPEDKNYKESYYDEYHTKYKFKGDLSLSVVVIKNETDETVIGSGSGNITLEYIHKVLEDYIPELKETKTENETNKTPGFELLFAVISIFIILVWKRKKWIKT